MNKNLFPDDLNVKQLAGNYHLLIWIEEEDGSHCASIAHGDCAEQWTCFANEDENGLVKIRDHGWIPGQYLDEEELRVLANIGLVPDNEFVSFDEFLKYIQL